VTTTRREPPAGEAPGLVDLLKLDRIDETRFLGCLQALGREGAFGGTVVGQALASGMLTVPGRLPHSLHAYFLLPGDTQTPVAYEVESVRDGHRFSIRRVQAVQGDRIIFTMLVSFQEAERGLEHQDSMPQVPPPEELPTTEALMKRWLDGLDKDDVRRRSASPRRAVFELRHVLSGGFFGGAPLCAENQFWFRAVDPLPAKPLVHYSALAYASDYGPMATAVLPHGKAPVDLDVRLASIDHSMWFHREANLNDWFLYDLHTPSGQDGRALTFGKIFSQDGRLVASIAQEGVMRHIMR
jgi:acyl-CoA thioesterase-2